MAQNLTVSFVTPQRGMLTGDVDSVVAPSISGEVQILPGHRDLLAELGTGHVELRVGLKKEEFAISGGFLEVANGHVVILAEAAEARAGIDVARAQATLKDAEHKLKTLSAQDAAYAEQGARAARARNRLEVAGR